jgi:hypothetical protein
VVVGMIPACLARAATIVRLMRVSAAIWRSDFAGRDVLTLEELRSEHLLGLLAVPPSRRWGVGGPSPGRSDMRSSASRM